MVKTTRKQREALKRKYMHGQYAARGISYTEFRRTIQPSFGMDNAIVVRWCGMYLAIEKDGYTHS
jgi:hypothetical protein